MSATTDNSTTISKEIRYERETRDFSMWVDGAYVGSAPTRSEAERRMDELVYDMLVHGAADVSRVPVKMAYSAEEEVTSLSAANVEVCFHDNGGVTIFTNQKMLQFNSPAEQLAFRALIQILDHPQARALLTT